MFHRTEQMGYHINESPLCRVDASTSGPSRHACPPNTLRGSNNRPALASMRLSDPISTMNVSPQAFLVRHLRCGPWRSAMTIIERALELVTNGSHLGLGSGHASQAFVKALGERLRTGRLRVRAVPTSEETADFGPAGGHTVADPCGGWNPGPDRRWGGRGDPQLDLIKGYGRDLVARRSSLLPPSGWSSSWATRSLSHNWACAANCRSR